MVYLLALFCGFSLIGNQRIVIDIPTYNNKEWCSKNLDSVFAQKYDNYHVIITDDCSTDGNAQLIEKYIAKRKLQKKVTLIKNKTRQGALANHYRVIHMCRDSDIIIHLDGDDFLPHPYVLSYINGVYENPQVWVTFGQFKNWPTQDWGYAHKIPSRNIWQRSYRTEFFYGHLRTCRAWLAKQIKLQDLICEDEPCMGKFYGASCDLALMFPLLEMANGKYKYVNKLLYMRNIANRLNDFKVNYGLQQRCNELIKSSPIYPAIKQKITTSRQKPVIKTIVYAFQEDSIRSFLHHYTKSIKGIYKTEVITNSPVDITIKQSFPYYNFRSAKKNVRKAFLEMLADKMVTHILLLDSHTMLPSFNAQKYAQVMDKTFAYTAFINPLADIECYEKFEKIGIWKLGLNTQVNPHTCRGALYRKSDLLGAIKNAKEGDLNSILSSWLKVKPDGHKIGLFRDVL